MTPDAVKKENERIQKAYPCWKVKLHQNKRAKIEPADLQGRELGVARRMDHGMDRKLAEADFDQKSKLDKFKVRHGGGVTAYLEHHRQSERVRRIRFLETRLSAQDEQDRDDDEVAEYNTLQDESDAYKKKYKKDPEEKSPEKSEDSD